MSEFVLDASALMAVAKGEPGHEWVIELLPKARLSAVNLSEFVARLLDIGFSEEEVRQLAATAPCEVEAFDEETAISAGCLRPATRSRGLSLGDRACLALGRKLGLPVLTADRAWASLDVGVEVVLIR